MKHVMTTRTVWLGAILIAGAMGAQAQQAPEKPQEKYLPVPAFDSTAMDTTADPCSDFYKFSCGRFAANHPIPADQSSSNQFSALQNVNTQALSGILVTAAAGGAGRKPNEQKIGDFYAACMDTAAIDAKGLEPIQPMLAEIDGLGSGMRAKLGLAPVIGRLQRVGVDVFFGFGEQQDFKDATKQIAIVDQGGLGMPERDYYLRTGAKDEELRQKYVAHVARMLVLAGATPEAAAKQARDIMAFETTLAKASMPVVDRRDPEKTYHLQPIATFRASIPGFNFSEFEQAIHTPDITEINNANPAYGPALSEAVRNTDMATLKAYMKYHLLTTVAGRLPKKFDDENFDFYARTLRGQQEQQARWKRCSNSVNGALGEALGEMYVSQYFAGDSKARMLEMVHDIEHAMDEDLTAITWMSDATKVKAREKLHGIANKIGYPDKFRDYSALTIKRDDPMGNQLRADAFENDRQLNKIGKPVDHSEWGMTPPTVNAYYDPSMNDINFPAGILQPAFYDPKVDDAVNYGHIGVVIGHELTHGFDDEGRKFGPTGNLDDWWTATDTKNFEAKANCLADQYSSYLAVDDVHVNGRLTLGENTADNGGLLLGYLAYMERAKQQQVDLTKKVDGYTPAQRFYIAYAQNWCENDRPESVRQQVLTNEHAPGHFRANGAIVNQPAFGAAFGCKVGAPMVPANSCRIW